MTVNGTTVTGRGSAQDVLEASAKSFLNAVNRVFFNQKAAVKETAKI
jgi:2-isopropylmalate synthase